MRIRITLSLILVTGLFSAQLLFADMSTLDVSRLTGAKVQYREYSQITQFPAPVISWRRAGLASGSGEITEIKEKSVKTQLFRARKELASLLKEKEYKGGMEP